MASYLEGCDLAARFDAEIWHEVFHWGTFMHLFCIFKGRTLRPLNERRVILQLTNYLRRLSYVIHFLTIIVGTPKPSIYWWINGMPAPLGLVLDSTFSLANDDRQMSSSHWSLPPSSEAVSSTLSVGVVQRGDVDTTYTCLASNSNMTQASRATLHLQMNRKPLFCPL